MSLMSKNKPTKKVDFPGGFVVLQHLSKGVKAEYQQRMTGLYKDIEVLEKLEKSKDTISLPKDMNLEAVLQKVNEAEYFKVARAIKSWSEEDEVSEESVQELDEEIFMKISEEINSMNQLSKAQEKN